MGTYANFHRRSIEERDAFWAEQAKLVDWQTPPQQICNYDNPPFAKWFVGGKTNLCHNAVDRHLADLPPEQLTWAAGLRYGTLSWGAWKAWSEGDHALALAVLGPLVLLLPWSMHVLLHPTLLLLEPENLGGGAGEAVELGRSQFGHSFVPGFGDAGHDFAVDFLVKELLGNIECFFDLFLDQIFR